MPFTKNYKRFSSVWRNIIRPLISQSNYSTIFVFDLRFSLGNGSKIKFWRDNWTNRGTLCIIFPRIFILSANKEGKINEFGSWINAKWVWRIVLRMRLFGWEIQQWLDFFSTLKGHVVCDNLNDSLI
ncbi:hypothetical protein CRYUN_Cryun17cG0050600 [Craigia yunnanensis]